MTNESSTALKKRVYLQMIAALCVLGLMLFVPAGSWYYWQGWMYLGVVFLPFVFAAVFFLKTDSGLLERRMRMREKEGEQKTIVLVSSAIFFIGFLFSGLDYRFGWSAVPVPLVLAADMLVFLGYVLTFFTLRENSYASRIIETEKGQKVISTGPYAYVRHPMYLGMIVMFLFTPLALGSFWAVIPFLTLPVFIVLRCLSEEEMLLRELQGYREYCDVVRYRLIPFVW